MKRNKFIAALITLTTSPAILISQTKLLLNSAAKGFEVDAGKDRNDKPISLFEGDTFFTKVSTADTNGALYMFESARDKKGGPPLHYHYEQDEWWYILEGEFLFKVGDKTFTAKKGDSVFGSRMVPDAFAKTNDGPARLMMAFQPAGKMEEHFKNRSEGLYDKLTKEGEHKIRQQHGFEVTGPALTYEKR